jgi:DNA-binding transcriptional LysR family regulator
MERDQSPVTRDSGLRTQDSGLRTQDCTFSSRCQLPGQQAFDVGAGGSEALLAAFGTHRETLRVHEFDICYAEKLLGLKVFELRGRKSVLTPAGQVLYHRGKALVEDAGRLELTAHELAKGWEPEVRLAVEIVFPTWLLLECVDAFALERADTRLELYETVLGGNEELLVGRKVDLAIAPRVPEGHAGDLLMPVHFVCVAAPSHPLHRFGRDIAPEELRAHRNIVIRDTAVNRTPSGSWLTVSHKATSIRAAVMGLGYAWYPEESVRQELDSGTLKMVPLVTGAERAANLYLVFADRETAGPGTRRLAGIIREKVKTACRAEAQLKSVMGVHHSVRSPSGRGRRQHDARAGFGVGIRVVVAQRNTQAGADIRQLCGIDAPDLPRNLHCTHEWLAHGRQPVGGTALRQHTAVEWCIVCGEEVHGPDALPERRP